MNTPYHYLKLETHQLLVPYQNKERRVRVLLPKGYTETAHADERFPVVYMHDGQNVFYSRESYSGHSWKVIPAIKHNPDLPKMIIVGIDNDSFNRINEYTPWKITKGFTADATGLGGLGADYASFVMETVKPFIDAHYRSKPEKEFTALIGSSLGGNISSYMGIAYKDQIGALGIFSLANWITDAPFERYIKRSSLDPSQRIYIQVGTQEGDATDQKFINGNMKQTYIDCTVNYQRQLIEGNIPIKNIQLKIAADAEHNEKAWARYLPECLRFLSENW